MESKPISPTEKALLLDTTRKIRTALDKRADTLESLMRDYDEAVEGDDKNKVLGCALLLMLSVTMLDPVGAVLREYEQVRNTLRRIGADVES